MSEHGSEGQFVATESTPSTAVAEKMLPQSQVDSLIGREKREAYEKGKSDAMRNMPESNSVQHTTTTPYASADDIARRAEEGALAKLRAEREAEKQAAIRQYQEEQAQNVYQQFEAKLLEAEQQKPGVREKAYSLNLREVPHLVHLAASIPDGAAVMEQVYENPHWASTLNDTARVHGVDAALRSLAKLRAAVDLNERAKNVRIPNDPLTQIQPSPVNTDSGPQTVSDFRRIFR